MKNKKNTYRRIDKENKLIRKIIENVIGEEKIEFNKFMYICLYIF